MSTSEYTEEPLVARSATFNAPNADVTFKSSDGVLFAVHKKNLAFNTGGFPPADIKSEDEKAIELPETSEALELLFQFIYPLETPSLTGLSFNVFEQLARAAEKYMVYAAMGTCRMRMLYLVQKCEHEDLKSIIKYASDHSYIDIIDEAAPLLMSTPLRSSIFLFVPSLQTAWALYREQWVETHQKAREVLALHGLQCTESSGTCTISPLSSMAFRLFDMPKLDSFQLRCKFNCSQFIAWKDRLQGEVNSLPKFSSFC